MPRGYRLLVIALGLALCGAKQPTQDAKAGDSHQQHQTTRPAAASPTPAPEPPYRAYPERYADSCYSSDSHDSADLCAQWRAALAAEKAANEARLATIAAIIGTIFSLATVVGLIITIYQTNGALGEARRGNRLNLLFEKRYRREARKSAQDQDNALKIAERNAGAAEKLAEGSQATAKLQLRPYLTAEDFTAKGFAAGANFGVDITVRNRGATPAINVIVVAYMTYRADRSTLFGFVRQPNDTDGASRSIIAAQGNILVPSDCGIETTEDLLADQRSGKAAFFCWGVIIYDDIFGDQHSTNFRVEVEQNLTISHCTEGNHAT